MAAGPSSRPNRSDWGPAQRVIVCPLGGSAILNRSFRPRCRRNACCPCRSVTEIRTLSGLSPAEPLTLRRAWVPATIPETEASLITKALATRPDLKAALLRERLAENGITLAKSQAVPNATAFVRYGRESLHLLTTVGGATFIRT